MISEIVCLILVSVICANAADVSPSAQSQIVVSAQQELRGKVNLTKISVNSSVPFSRSIKVDDISEDDLSKATFSIYLPVLNENVSLSDSITVTTSLTSLNLTIMAPNENYYGVFYVQIFVNGKFVKRVEIETISTSPVIAKSVASQRVVEGKSVTFYCDVRGIKDNTATVQWLRPDSQSEWNRLVPVSVSVKNVSQLNITSKNQLGDTLQVIDLNPEDGGSYVCQVTVDQATTTFVYELRVKDRLAALWPLIGIVIEIIILVVAILVYEQRRSKQAKANKEAEKATLMAGGDQQGGKADDHGEKDAETRLRAVKA